MSFLCSDVLPITEAIRRQRNLARAENGDQPSPKWWNSQAPELERVKHQLAVRRDRVRRVRDQQRGMLR